MMLPKIFQATRLLLPIAKDYKQRITRFKGIKAMLENKQEISKSPHVFATVAAMAGAAIVHNYLKGGRDMAALRTETELCTNDLVDAEETLIWFVGCMQDGKDTFSELTKRTNNINLITPRLPEARPDGKIDELEICKKVIDQLLATRAKKPKIIADSRGALDAAALLKYAHETGIAEQFDGFGKIIFNASPHDGQDITASRNRLLNGAILLQHFAAPNQIKPYFMRKAGYASNAGAPLSKIALEGKNIRAARAVNPLPAVFEELIYVRGQHPDPTVYSKQAAEKFLQDTPDGLFSEYIDESRKPGEHIGGKRRFDVLLQLAGIEPVSTTSSQESLPLFSPLPQAA